jgi:hypothetical protein
MAADVNSSATLRQGTDDKFISVLVLRYTSARLPSPAGEIDRD